MKNNSAFGRTEPQQLVKWTRNLLAGLFVPIRNKAVPCCVISLSFLFFLFFCPCPFSSILVVRVPFIPFLSGSCFRAPTPQTSLQASFLLWVSFLFINILQLFPVFTLSEEWLKRHNSVSYFFASNSFFLRFFFSPSYLSFSAPTFACPLANKCSLEICSFLSTVFQAYWGGSCSL